MTLPEGFTHRLTVRRVRGVINTAYQELPVMRRRQRYNPAYLHPDDFVALDLVPGDGVEIVSAHGRIPAIVEADTALRPGVVSMTHGWGSVLEDEKGGYMESGASTCFLVDAEAREPINAMVRLTAIPVNIVKRPVAA
jgi:anaerobic selenocysteine-containing dehydrogenase